MKKQELAYEENMWQLFHCSKEAMPDLANAYYGHVKNAVYKDGALSLKTKRLMALSIAIQAGCKDCMISQTASALESGGTPSEIFEACSVAISMGGTLAWSNTLIVIGYLKEKGIINKP